MMAFLNEMPFVKNAHKTGIANGYSATGPLVKMPKKMQKPAIINDE